MRRKCYWYEIFIIHKKEKNEPIWTNPAHGCEIRAALVESPSVRIFTSPIPGHFMQTLRYPQYRKHITYRNATRRDRATTLRNMHNKFVKIGRVVVSEICSRTDTQTQR